jgi:L-idonate 5-dehydrogenase
VKAVAVHGAHDLRVEDRPTPQPGPGEVLLSIEWGGVCGSDVAYYNHAASGTAVLKHPLVLGHEFAGTVIGLGPDVTDVQIGERAAVYPPTLIGDGKLPDRIAGRVNLYPNTRYYGSAATDPHTDGGFVEQKVVRADQLRRLPETVSTREGALAEPLGVAVHAVHRAQTVERIEGRTILVNGSGPIGCLVVAVLKAYGAAEVIAADISDQSLAIAKQMGADRIVNSANEALPQDIELVFEASGAAAALGGVLHATARGGTLVQVGNLPATPVSAVLGDLVTREITWLGSFRFVDEMDDAIELMAKGLNLEPVMTHVFGIDDADEALRTAADRSTGSSKVMLKLSPSPEETK